MKLTTLQAAVRTKLAQGSLYNPLPHVVDEVVKMTIEQMGFHVSADNEVCDPRPAAPSAPGDNWRAAGGRRRRK